MRSYEIEYISEDNWRQMARIEADDHIREDATLTLLLEGKEIARFNKVLTWHFTDIPEQPHPAGF